MVKRGLVISTCVTIGKAWTPKMSLQQGLLREDKGFTWAVCCMPPQTKLLAQKPIFGQALYRFYRCSPPLQTMKRREHVAKEHI